jgi:hypothetical protein
MPRRQSIEIGFCNLAFDKLFSLATNVGVECQKDREETSHLFAFCEALSPIRMRILGESTLAQNFKWSPNTLLEMITEIDKLCPEEGHPNQQSNH